MSTDTRSSVDLDIQGMTCASCAARIEKKLNKVDGVAASVNYATEKAHVLAPTGLSVDDLIKVVQDAGYDARVPEPDDEPIDRAGQLRTRLIIAAVLSIPVVAMAMVPPLQFPGWQWLSLALATPVVVWAGWGFHRSALVNLRHGATTMDTLISMGTISAYLWSLYCMIFGTAGEIGMRHHFSFTLMRDDSLSSIYFEAASGIITFILLGRYIEAKSRKDAGSALRALLEMGAKRVTVLRDGAPHEVPIEDLQVGESFLVQPGTKIATDGEVIEGSSAVDASMITGESVPVEVGPGSHVVGATVNTNGSLVVRATAVGANTQLSQIARLVEAAQTGKTNVQRLADKISGIFVPIVIGISLVTLAVWLIMGGGISLAITAAVSVLIISCPCALGLATPTALLAGTGRGAELGIVIRGPEVLERAYQVDTIVMDKTGTITEGRMSVASVVAGEGVAADEVLARAAALEASSEHPIARAIVQAAPAAAVQADRASLTDFTNLPGLGIEATLHGVPTLVGSPALMARRDIPVPDDLTDAADRAADEGSTVVMIAWDGRVRGVLAVSDTIAADSGAAIQGMQRLGLRTLMLTGDNARAAAHVASQVGIDDVRADVLPGDKLTIIRELQDAGAKVAMIGDGVNDAAALTQSDLGIAMGGGTDVAIAASDLTLMRHDLGLATDAIRLSRRTLGTIRGNLFWAFAYNVAALPIAALALLTPMLAGAAMAFSSVFVVTNSLRLRGFTPTRV